MFRSNCLDYHLDIWLFVLDVRCRWESVAFLFRIICFSSIGTLNFKMKFPLNSDGSFRVERSDGVPRRPSRGVFLCALVGVGPFREECMGFCFVFYLNGRVAFCANFLVLVFHFLRLRAANHCLFHGVRLLKTLLLCVKVPLVGVLACLFCGSSGFIGKIFMRSCHFCVFHVNFQVWQHSNSAWIPSKMVCFCF